MVSDLPSRWSVAAPTFVLWALVAASAVYWGLRLSSPRSGPTAPAVVRAPAAADTAAVARLLGSTPAATIAAPAAAAPTRYVLVGVVAGRSHNGAALISVDGKPAKPFRVGAAVDEGLVLQSVQARRALLGASAAGPATLTLELPLARK